ncbi:MAG: hypothetical protein Q4B85_12605 [Lachnospiraceae bacterium]|nr:hypothetical protein [Lachnospiraceae bacterium]
MNTETNEHKMIKIVIKPKDSINIAATGFLAGCMVSLLVCLLATLV